MRNLISIRQVWSTSVLGAAYGSCHPTLLPLRHSLRIPELFTCYTDRFKTTNRVTCSFTIDFNIHSSRFRNSFHIFFKELRASHSAGPDSENDFQSEIFWWIFLWSVKSWRRWIFFAFLILKQVVLATPLNKTIFSFFFTSLLL